MTGESVLDEQRRYYAARAPEYDDWWFRRGRYELAADAKARWDADVAEVETALSAFGPVGDVLELAAGTGLWTRHLVRTASRLVAVDASAETLALNRAARSWAVLQGRRYVTPEDVERLFIPVLLHRLLFRPSFLAEIRDRGWGAASLAVRPRCLARPPKAGLQIAAADPSTVRESMSLFLHSSTLDYVKMVDLSTLSSLQWNAISLDPYSAEQLYDILLSRSQQAFREGDVDDGSLQMAAELASIYGDARYAIELIYRAGKLAEVADSGKVMPEHVRRAKASLPPQFRKEELVYLDKHQRVMLMAISGMLRKSDSAFTTIGEVEKNYNALCESMGMAPNHHTQVWNDVNELARKGIIETQLSGKGFRGRTTMIGLSMVSAEQLIEELHKEA